MPLFTVENAAEMGAKGGLASARVQAEAEAKRVVAAAEAEKIAEFTEKTLARVRLQMDQIFEMFTKEKDPAKLDRLAAAQSRLSEQERILAGRPMPGSLRPTTKPKRTADPAPSPTPNAEPDQGPDFDPTA